MAINEMYFTAAHSSETIIQAEGSLDTSYCINPSDILTRLIQEAGRYCKHYAGDLFHIWRTIEEKIDRKFLKTERYLFGFRENGVDGNSFILSKYNGDSNIQTLASYEYRSIWILDIAVNDEDRRISMKLFEAYRIPRTSGNPSLPWD